MKPASSLWRDQFSGAVVNIATQQAVCKSIPVTRMIPCTNTGIAREQLLSTRVISSLILGVPTREQLPILLHQELQRCTRRRLICVDSSSTEQDDEYIARRYPSWNSRLDATRRVLLGWFAVDQTMQCPNS
jgi:hypothetical protein